MLTSWIANSRSPWIQIDLGIPKFICSVDIEWHDGDIRAYSFTILTSNDGIAFSPVYSGTSSGANSSYEKYSLSSGSTKYLRIRIEGSTADNDSLVGIKEISIKGY
jgi:hypothetical protein